MKPYNNNHTQLLGGSTKIVEGIDEYKDVIEDFICLSSKNMLAKLYSPLQIGEEYYLVEEF